MDVEVVVIVYVAGEVNVFVFHPVLLPPDQENVLPPLPVNDILVCVHVNSVVPLLFVILAVGLLLFVNTTSSVLELHGEFAIVHLKVVLLPAVTPVTAEVAEEALVILPEPLTILQVPVPEDGVFPAKVKLASAH